MNIQEQDKLYTAEELRGFAAGDYAVTVLSETASTNQVLRTLAESGAKEGTAVFAHGQTGGYGRFGRPFFSPKGTGLYFSVLLRPPKGCDAAEITLTAAVAVAEAVEQCTGISLQIKWVNDLYKGDKKVAGILAQGVTDPNGGLAYCILGIGLNVYAPAQGFGALAPIADALNAPQEKALLPRLGAAVLDRFFERYHQDSFPACLAEYRRRAYLTGKTVTVVRGNEQFRGKVEGVDETGALLLERDGILRAFSSGEVTLEDYR